MAETKRYFWSHWPTHSQQRFFKLMLMGTVLLTLSITIGFRILGGTMAERINDARDLYGQVVIIVEDIRSLRAEKGEFAHLPVEQATQALINDLGIGEKILSMRTSPLENNTDGVQVTFQGLSMNQLTAFMKGLRDQASLQTPKYVLTRNEDEPRLADLHVVLAR